MYCLVPEKLMEELKMAVQCLKRSSFAAWKHHTCWPSRAVLFYSACPVQNETAEYIRQSFFVASSSTSCGDLKAWEQWNESIFSIFLHGIYRTISEALLC